MGLLEHEQAPKSSERLDGFPLPEWAQRENVRQIASILSGVGVAGS
jgi:hypothetical protein